MHNAQMDISNRYMPVALDWLQNNILHNFKDVICTLHCNNTEDIYQHIDATISFTNSKDIRYTTTWQIKTITDMAYNHFTIEYMNNRYTGEWGEIKEIQADYYLHARVGEDNIIYNVGVVNMKEFMKAYENNLFNYHISDNPDSNANFLCVDWNELKNIKGVVYNYKNTMHLYNTKVKQKLSEMYENWKANGEL